MGTSQSERLDGDSVATLCNSTMNASFGGYSRVKPYTAWRAVLRSSVSNSAYFLSVTVGGRRPTVRCAVAVRGLLAIPGVRTIRD